MRVEYQKCVSCKGTGTRYSWDDLEYIGCSICNGQGKIRVEYYGIDKPIKKKSKCDCHKHKHQVCDICQKVTGKEKDKEPLTFNKLREVNHARCINDIRAVESWTPLEWGGALAGETGELCNLLKKLRRGEKIKKKDMAHELADIITYADLVAIALDIDLEEAVREKFNIVSKRWKSKYRL